MDVLLELLSSTSSSEDDNEILLSNMRTSIPKINNYVKDVVHEMTDKQVGYTLHYFQ